MSPAAEPAISSPPGGPPPQPAGRTHTAGSAAIVKRVHLEHRGRTKQTLLNAVELSRNIGK